MFSFVRRFLGFDKIEHHHRQIDQTEVCVIAVDALECPICYSIYSGTPLVLQCGHSFCAACIQRITPSQSNARTLCPKCRKVVSFGRIVKNYELKSILDSVHEISRNEEQAGRAYTNNMQITNEMLREQLAEAKTELRDARTELISQDQMLREQLAEAKTELQEAHQAAQRNYLMMGVIGIAMFAYVRDL